MGKRVYSFRVDEDVLEELRDKHGDDLSDFYRTVSNHEADSYLSSTEAELRDRKDEILENMDEVDEEIEDLKESINVLQQKRNSMENEIKRIDDKLEEIKEERQKEMKQRKQFKDKIRERVREGSIFEEGGISYKPLKFEVDNSTINMDEAIEILDEVLKEEDMEINTCELYKVEHQKGWGTSSETQEIGYIDFRNNIIEIKEKEKGE